MTDRSRSDEMTRLAATLGANPDHPVVAVPPEEQLERCSTGMFGFDQITMGGLPKGRSTLVAGPAGSGKTIMAAQFLREGALGDEPGIFVTFEEPAEDLRRNLASLGWPVEGLEADQRWSFVDSSPLHRPQTGGITDFDVVAANVGHEVDRLAAGRVVLDSVSAVFDGVEQRAGLRQQLREFLYTLRRMHLTVLMTMEARSEGFGPVQPMGFEEFLADNVVVLRNSLEDEKRRRTVEVLKMRGAAHRRGEYPFTLLSGRGIVVIPLSVVDLAQQSTLTRITSGNAGLDEMCSGGFFRDSVVLVSGATGTGKTLTMTEFMGGGAQNGERCLLFAFEESHDQIFRNAAGWGRDFAAYEKAGLLHVAASYPEVASLEDHLLEIVRQIEKYKPDRIAIDSLSALERSGTAQGFREFMIVLTSYIKAKQVAALFTATAPTLLGGDSVTDGHISTLTDSIILLRYAEVHGDVKRGLTVLKMRGSRHDTRIHQFTIGARGMQIRAPFRGVTGILSGRTTQPADGIARQRWPWRWLSRGGERLLTRNGSHGG